MFAGMDDRQLHLIVDMLLNRHGLFDIILINILTHVLSGQGSAFLQPLLLQNRIQLVNNDLLRRT